MELENILALSFSIPTLLLAIYGVLVARRNSTGQSEQISQRRNRNLMLVHMYADDTCCVRSFSRTTKPIIVANLCCEPTPVDRSASGFRRRNDSSYCRLRSLSLGFHARNLVTLGRDRLTRGGPTLNREERCMLEAPSRASMA